MAVSITQTANPAGVASSANVTTYSSQSIGAASAERLVVVALAKTGAAINPTGITIDYGTGALAMTLADGVISSGGNELGAWLYYLNAPTGTTATIAITWDATITAVRNHIAIYSVLGAAAAPSATGTDTSLDMDATSPLTAGTQTIPTGGGMLALACCGNESTAKTWANLTENIDASTGSGGLRFTTAFSTTASTSERRCQGTITGEGGSLAWAIFSQFVANPRSRGFVF